MAARNAVVLFLSSIVALLYLNIRTGPRKSRSVKVAPSQLMFDSTTTSHSDSQENLWPHSANEDDLDDDDDLEDDDDLDEDDHPLQSDSVASAISTTSIIADTASSFTLAPTPATTMDSDKLRLVIVSDTHRSFPDPVPAGDVLIHCGDSEWNVDELESWATAQSHAHKIVICGNMDDSLSHANSFSAENITYLQDNAVEISGVKFYGSPWTPEFVGVFQLDSYKEAKDTWKNIPVDTDVLITHGPPKGILDMTSRGGKVGDRALLDALINNSELQPRVHCFGHVHKSYGTSVQNDILFCNAAVFNGNRPIVVDLPLDRSLPPVVVTDY